MAILDTLDHIDAFIIDVEGSSKYEELYKAWGEFLTKLGSDRKSMSLRCDEMSVSVQEVLMMERTAMQTAYEALSLKLDKIYSESPRTPNTYTSLR